MSISFLLYLEVDHKSLIKLFNIGNLSNTDFKIQYFMIDLKLVRIEAF